MKGNVYCLLVPILIQVITVSCQNETTPSSSEDLITTSHPMSVMAMTSSTERAPIVEEKSTTTGKRPVTTQSPKETTTEANSSGEKTVAMTTSPPKPTVTSKHPAVETNKPTHHSEPGHTSEPTHHGDKNTTNTTHGGHGVHPGPHGSMGYPHEPPVVSAHTEQKEDNGWQISVLVVCSLLIAMVAFVIVFVIKGNREYKRRKQLRSRKRKRAVNEDEKVFALKMIKTEEPKANPIMEKIKEEKELKRFSMHSRGDPEESIPLLKLHIMDHGHPVLGGPSDEPQESQDTEDTKPSEPSTSEKDSKPLLEEINANLIDPALV